MAITVVAISELRLSVMYTIQNEKMMYFFILPWMMRLCTHTHNIIIPLSSFAWTGIWRWSFLRKDVCAVNDVISRRRRSVSRMRQGHIGGWLPRHLSDEHWRLRLVARTHSNHLLSNSTTYYIKISCTIVISCCCIRRCIKTAGVRAVCVSSKRVPGAHCLHWNASTIPLWTKKKNGMPSSRSTSRMSFGGGCPMMFTILLHSTCKNVKKWCIEFSLFIFLRTSILTFVFLCFK